MQETSVSPASTPGVVADAIAEARAEGVEAGAAVAEARVEAVAAEAAQAVAAAESANRVMADAMANTEICRRIDALERQIGGDTWQREMFARLEAMATQTTEALTKLSTLLSLLLLMEEEREEAPAQSTPEPSGASPASGDVAEDLTALGPKGLSGKRRLI